VSLLPPIKKKLVKRIWNPGLPMIRTHMNSISQKMLSWYFKMMTSSPARSAFKTLFQKPKGMSSLAAIASAKAV